jgi:transposase
VLTLPSSVRIYLAAGPVDLRRSIDGLSAIVAERGHDVYSGHLYAFVSRRGDRIKILTWDHGGFVLYYKRLERGRFRLPERREGGNRPADPICLIGAFSGRIGVDGAEAA